MTENYRGYKKLKKELEKADDRLKQLMVKFEIREIEKTRKMKNFF